MNINDFLSEYPSIDDPSFQYKIAQKKEFADLKLDEYETEPSVDGNYKHQVTVERFLSDKTPYDSLLVCFGTGIGKTKTGILVSEKNLKSNSKYRKTLFLAKSSGIIENFKDKLREYDPEYSQKSKMKKYYDFNTFDKFSKNIARLSDEEIIKQYSNKVIIIDEAHNLRIHPVKKDKPDTKIIYKNFDRFLHLAHNSKVLLLTATPIWDKVNEIASLMNLILPKKDQITYKDFEKEYFDAEGNLVKKEELAKKLSGRVTFVRQEQSDVYKEYEGVIRNPLKKLKLVYDDMSKHQLKSLLLAGKVSNKAEGLRVEELEASSFVFPDGSYGDKGIAKNCISSDKGRKYVFKTEDLKKEIRDNLKKYSAKIDSTVKQILKHPNENVFVYHPRVKSGTFLVGMILELYGFSKTFGSGDIFSTKKRRYAIISSESATPVEVEQILKAFNDPRNKNGEYIQVLIGSKKISEGITLKNVQQMHVIVPPWNLSGMDQITGRTVRIKSHDALLKSLIGSVKFSRDSSSIKVKIFLHASSYKDKSTADIEVYKIAEVKDYKTRQIIRILKESAIDCPLTYKRNFNKGDQAHSRDCDYQDCKYECLTFKRPKEDSKESDFLIKNIDPTNYNLFYSNKEINEIKNYIEKLFKFYTSIDINIIEKFIKDTNKVTILRALEDIINKKIIILDKYGFPSILRENENAYYLQSASNTNDEKLLKRDNGIVLSERTPLKQILDIMKIRESKKFIDELCLKKNAKDVVKIYEKLDHHVQILIFETCYDITVKNPSNIVAKSIVEFMDSFFYKMSNSNVLKYAFDQLDHSLKVSKGKHTIDWIELMVDVVKGIYPKGTEKAMEVERNYLAKNMIKAREMIKALEKESLEAVGKSKSMVHSLYHFEKHTTGYKRELNQGELRMYSEAQGEWVVPGKDLEKIFINTIKSLKEKSIKEINKDNEYGVSGTIDQNVKDEKKKFKLLDKTSKKGFVCASTSDKERLVKIILDLRIRERELDGETTLEIPNKRFTGATSELANMKVKFDYTEYIREDKIAIYEMTFMNVKTLCDMIQGWLGEKGLLREI